MELSDGGFPHAACIPIWTQVLKWPDCIWENNFSFYFVNEFLLTSLQTELFVDFTVNM